MSRFDSSVILPILSVFLIFILNMKIFMTKASKQHFPPGPGPLPIIGNLYILNLKRPYQTMLEASLLVYSVPITILKPLRKTPKTCLILFNSVFTLTSPWNIFFLEFPLTSLKISIENLGHFLSLACVNLLIKFWKFLKVHSICRDQPRTGLILCMCFPTLINEFPCRQNNLTLIDENVKLFGGPRIA
ncbi:cytochrome p450 2f2-like, partial [Lynx pardinus]